MSKTAKTVEESAADYGHNSGQQKPVLPLTFEIVEITPEMAKDMLATTDRGIETKDQKKAVDVYGQSMSNGAWIRNGMPVIFDEEGKLLDGVLRLNAAVAANTSFTTFVARNVRADTLHTIDQHRRRLYQGVLESRGIQNAGSVVRLMGKMIRIENGDFGMAELPISWSRYDRVLDANPELQQASQIANNTRGSALHSTARPALAFMAIKAGKLHELHNFLRELGPNHTQGFDCPPRMLAMQFALLKDGGKGYETDTSLAMSVMAFNDFINGRKATTYYTWEPNYGGVPVSNGKPTNRSELREKAPKNLGLPLVEGYTGLRDGAFDVTSTTDEFGGMTSDTLVAGVLSDAGDEDVRMMTVTPDMAREWMQWNTGNRKIQQSHIQAIKRDIIAGNWMMNAQPICFTADPNNPPKGVTPRLLNGQHRLHAIIAADLPVEIPIAVGIPEEAFATYDIHAKRSSVEPGRNRVDTRVVSAAARLQWKEDNGYQLIGGKEGSPTASELMDIVRTHPGLEEAFPLSRRKGLVEIATSGVLTYFIYRITRENAGLAEEFLRGLETGAELKSGNPILGLRKMLAEEREDSRRGEILNALLDGWSAYQEWSEGKGGKTKAKGKAKDVPASNDEAEEGDETQGDMFAS